MSGERLTERRNWFRVFPEGTLEFMIITRVLALLMLIALAVVGGTQRPFVLIGLVGILWVDYVLLLWWLVQIGTDLQLVAKGQGQDGKPATGSIAVQAALPSIAMVAAVMPWGQLLTVVTGSHSPTVPNALSAAAGLAYLLLLWPAYRALRRAEVGSSIWTFLFLTPLLHFFALHRIASGLDSRAREQLSSQGKSAERGQSWNPAVIMADITWVLTILPWIIIIAVVLLKGWPTSSAFKFGPVCGTALAAVFAIANLAAMESVQRKIVAIIRKA